MAREKSGGRENYVSGPGYTTINIYPEDRNKARNSKRDGESWSEWIQRAADALNKDS